MVREASNRVKTTKFHHQIAKMQGQMGCRRRRGWSGYHQRGGRASRHVVFSNKNVSQYSMPFYVSQSPNRVNDLSEVYLKAYDVNTSPIDVIHFKNYLSGYPSKLFLEVLDIVKNGANLHSSLQFDPWPCPSLTKSPPRFIKI